MFCKKCGTNIDDNSNVCPNCGTQTETVENPVNTVVNQPSNANPVFSQPVYDAPPQKDKKGFALASLILGIASIPLVLCCYTGVITGILAIIFGILSLKSSKKGFAITGIILSVVAFIVLILLFVIGNTLINSPDFQKYIEDMIEQAQNQ